MKKFFVSVLAIASLAACSKDELVEQQSPAAISFEQAFVDNATRAAADPSTTSENITAFDVWGFMDQGEGLVFDAQRVTGSKSEGWSYSPLQYWLPDHNYYFAAISPVDHSNVVVTKASGEALKYGLGVVEFTNIDGTDDLLYAATSVDTHGKTINSSYDKVGLTFNHLLSKVKFSFTNGFAASNYYVTVENIKMTVPEKASINLAQEDWWSTNKWENYEGTTTLEFGNMETAKIAINETTECQNERLTIPAGADQEYVVTFDVTLYVGEVVAYTNTLTTKISGAALEIGKAYNFHATLNHTNVTGTELQPIVFEVIDVKEWVDGNGYDGGEIPAASTTLKVATVEELQKALDGATETTKIVLADNISGNVTITQNEGVYVILDGNDMTFDGTMTINGKSSTSTDKSLTIQNVNFATESTSAMDFISSSTDAVRYARNITIENCTFTAPEGTDVVAIRLRQAYEITVKGCKMNGGHSLAQITSSTNVDFENVTVVAGRGVNLQNALTGVANFVGCDITATKADGYGIRVDAKGANVMNVSGSVISAYEPIVLRNAEAAYECNIDTTTLTASGSKQIVVAGVSPTINTDVTYTM